VPQPSPLPPDDVSLRFPDGFFFGCATASHQVEGGNHNDWSEFERQPGRILDGSVSGIACDHWNRWPQDLDDLAALGQNAHRFSIEWSRVEPQEGRFDLEALNHYAAVAAGCRERGMEPFVTLHHFTLPLWLAERGGVLAPEAPARFMRYTAACAKAMGEQVRWWMTINEPVILAVLGYLEGEWPPARRSLPQTFAALRALVRMHAGAATALRAAARRHGWEARISIAHHMRGMTPEHPGSRLDRLVAAVPDLVLNRWFLLACRDGRLRAPVGRGQRVEGAVGSLDWIGLNYYADELVGFDLRRPGNLFARRGPDPSLPQSSFGWTIDPDGLRRALLRLAQEFPLPIVITENGVADEDDELRPRFIVDHLAAVHSAIAAGADVRGYLHWTSMDNFEWAQGYSKRFGLFAVDRQTMRRGAKLSAAVYARICRAGGIPRELLADPLAASPTGIASG
jgi:beta-glucosidase